jgi:hypothetical protein
VTRRRAGIGPRRDLRYISAVGTTGSGAVFAAPDKTPRARVSKIIRPAAGCGILVFAALTLANAAVAADDFPFSGNYTQNVACKGDGTDAEAAKVSISPQEIVSNIGTCTILDTKHNDNSFFAHVECKFPSGPLMGDVTFTPRPDKTIEFVDRDGTYKAVLYPCPK